MDVGDFNDLSDALDTLIEATHDAEAEEQDAFGNFKEELPDDLKDKFSNSELTKDADGHWKIKMSDGTEIDMDKYKVDLDDGNFDSAYRPIFGDALDTDAGKEFLDKSRSQYAQSEFGKADASIDRAIKFGNDAGFEDCCVDWNDFRDKCKANGWDIDSEQEKFKEAQERLKSEVGDDPPDKNAPQGQWDDYFKKVGDAMKAAGSWIYDKLKWIADMIKDKWFSLLLLGLLILFAKEIWDFVNSVGHAMSGCFSLYGDKKCKVYALTCRDDDMNPVSGFISDSALESVNRCKPCTDIACSNAINDSNGPWMPIKLSDQCACNPNASNKSCEDDPQNCWPGDYNPDASTGWNPCLNSSGQPSNPGKCPVTVADPYKCVREGYKFGEERIPGWVMGRIMGISPDGTSSACSNASGCVARCEACANNWGDNCSPWCDGTVIRTLKGQKLKCNNCNFGCAVGQVFGHFFGLPSKLLDEIIKVLLYVAVIIVVVVIGYYVLKKLFGWGEHEIFDHNSSKTGHQRIDIELDDMGHGRRKNH